MVRNLFAKLFNKSNVFYTVVFFVFTACLIANRIVLGFGDILWINDIGSFFGILYIIATAKHHISMHHFNFLSTLVLGVVMLLQNIYFNALLCLLVFCPIRVSGAINWNKNNKIDANLNLKKLNVKQLAACVGVVSVLIPVTMLVLWKLNSNLFYFDAVSTSLCLMGAFLSAYMYIDQFYFYIFASAVFIVQYVFLTIQNFNNISFGVMNVIFFIINIVGYFNWVKLKKAQENRKNILVALR